MMMTHEVELPRHWYSMTRLALICFAIGLSLVACSFVAWWLMLLPTADALRPVIAIFYDRWSLAVGLVAMGIGLSAWTRAWVAVRLVLPLLSLLMGIGLIAVTGYREVHAPASGLPQIPHAVMGVVTRLEPAKDRNGVIDGRLACVDGLEAVLRGVELRLEARQHPVARGG